MLSRLCSLFPVIHRESRLFRWVAKNGGRSGPCAVRPMVRSDMPSLPFGMAGQVVCSKNGLGGEWPQPWRASATNNLSSQPRCASSQESKQSYRNRIALTLVTEGPRGGAVMRAIGYLTIGAFWRCRPLHGASEYQNVGAECCCRRTEARCNSH